MTARREPRPRSRLRRLLRLAVWAAVLLVAARLLLALLLPWLVNLAAAGAGLRVRWQAHALSLTGLYVRFTGLEVHAAGAAQDDRPLLTATDVEVDVAALALLGGDLEVPTARVAGLRAHLERGADGALSLPGVAPAGAEEPPAPAPAPAPHEALSFGLPAQVRRLEVHDARLTVHDAGSDTEEVWHLDLTGRDLGVPERTAPVLLRLHSPGRLEHLDLRAEVETGPAGATGGLALRLSGCRPAQLVPWLALAGLEPVADRIEGTVGARVAARIGEDGAAQVEVHADFGLSTEAGEQIALDALDASARLLPSGALQDVRVAVEGLRAAGERTPEGALVAAGLRLLAEGATEPAPAARPPDAATGPADPAAAPLVELASLALRDVRVRLFTPRSGGADGEEPPPLELRVDEAQLGPWSARPGAEPAAMDLRLVAALPGIVERIAIENAQGDPYPPGHTVECSVALEGITLARLEPWLRRAGIGSTFRDGSLRLRLLAEVAAATDEGFTADLAVRDLELRDGGGQQLSLEEVSVRGLQFAPARRELSLGRIAVAGPDVRVLRAQDGSLELPGLVLRPAADEDAGEGERGQPVAAAGHTEEGAPWRIGLQSLRWQGAQIGFRDERPQPPLELALRDVELLASDLAVGRPASGGQPGRVRLSLSVAGVCERLSVEGTVAARPGGGAAALEILATGLDLDGLEPWLAPLGLEPALDDGRLALTATAEVGPEDDGTLADLQVRDLALQSGGETVLAVGQAALRGWRGSGERTSVATIRLVRPRLVLGRLADGSLQLPGLRTTPPAGGNGEPPEEPAPAQAAVAADAPRLRIDTVEVDQLQVLWTDARAAAEARGPERLELTADLDAGPVRVGADVAPTPLDLRIGLGDVLEELRLHGTATLDPQEPSLELRLQGRGLRGAALAGLLPPGLSVTLEDGALDATVAAAVRAGDGTVAAQLTVSDLEVTDGGAEIAAVDHLHVDVPALGEDLVHLSALELSGVRARVARSAEGLGLAGLRTAGGGSEARGGGEAGGPAAPPPEPLVLPPVRIDRIDLAVGPIEVHPDVGHGEPVAVSLRVRTTEPWATDPEDPAATGALPLVVTGAATPVVDQLELRADLFPFAPDPRVDASLEVSGIDADALARAAPALADRLGPGGMTDGRLRVQVSGELRLARRTPYELPLGHPFGFDLGIEELVLRDGEGPVLLGVAGVDAEVAGFDPATGALGIRSLLVDAPTIRLLRTAEGLHVGGLVLRPAAPPPPGAARPPAPPPDEGTPAAVGIDELTVNGLALQYRDETTTPPTLLPVDDLTLQVRHYRSKAAGDAVPTTIHAFLHGGDVRLPPRADAGSLLAGIVSSAARAVTGGGGDAETEPHAVVEEIALVASLQRAPVLRGRVRLDVRGFELRALRGLAAGGAVDIGDGVLDAGAVVELAGSEGALVLAQLVFSHLSLSEPAGGPISTYLRLPAPLDTVLFALRNSAGEHVVPLDFHVPPDGLDAGSIQRRAIEAFTRVVADAIAGAPLRVAGTAFGWLLDLFGFGGRENLAELHGAIPFAPGTADLPDRPPAELPELAPLVERLADDEEIALVLEHDLGQADLDVATLRANPPLDDLAAAIARLRRLHTELEHERRVTAARVRGLFAAGQVHAAEEGARGLRVLDDRIGGTQMALDRLLQQLRPGAGRRAPHRGRRAAAEIARQRLEAVRAWLAAAVGPEAAERIEVRPTGARVAAGGDATGRVTVRARLLLADEDPRRRKPIDEKGFGDMFGLTPEAAAQRRLERFLDR